MAVRLISKLLTLEIIAHAKKTIMSKGRAHEIKGINKQNKTSNYNILFQNSNSERRYVI